MSHPKRSVYLAGPITGLTHDEARHGWREEFAALMRAMELEHISLYSPMRGKSFLQHHGVLSSGEGYPDHPMARASGITTRDCNDVRFCDVLLGCFLETPVDENGNQIGSLGTAWEFGAAYVLGKPIVMVGAADNIHVKHVMMAHSSGYIVETLEDAAELIGFLLTPGI